MDITELYHFLFETPEGVGCLVGICLVLSLIVCVIMERRTRKRFWTARRAGRLVNLRR